MIPRPAALWESVWRGYGQLFLCPDPRSGLLFLAALCLASPAGGLRSLLGAGLVTLAALPFRPSPVVLRSGLFAVNGILLGLVWAWFPWVDGPTRLLTLVLCCLGAGWLLALSSRRLRVSRSPLTLLSLPYVALVWLSLLVLPLFHAHEPKLTRGWSELRAGRPLQAIPEFTAAEPASAHGQAQRQDGLGWSRLAQGDALGAAWHFQQAAALDSQFADPWDGLGWVRFRLQDWSGSRAAFERAVALDGGLADSWDGLGWLRLGAGETESAVAAFSRAVWAAPFFADAWTGLQQSLLSAGRPLPAERAGRVAQVLSSGGPPQPVLLPSRQLAAWLLMILAVWLHAPLSGLVLGAALALPALLGLTGLAVPHSAEFHLNLGALAIALGGHYLPPGRLAWLGLLLFLPAFTLLWLPLENLAWRLDLPLLNLPFNLAMLLLVALAALLQRSTGWRALVPLEIAVRSPREVRRWQLRADTAEACWKAVERSRPR